jgi:hypothetical protein
VRIRVPCAIHLPAHTVRSSAQQPRGRKRSRRRSPWRPVVSYEPYRRRCGLPSLSPPPSWDVWRRTSLFKRRIDFLQFPRETSAAAAVQAGFACCAAGMSGTSLADSACSMLIHFDKPAAANEIKEALETGDGPTKAAALKSAIMMLLNGEQLPQLFITIVRYVLPSDDNQVKPPRMRAFLPRSTIHRGESDACGRARARMR